MKWLGERTWEGFGRFRIDFNPLENMRTKDKSSAERPGLFTDNHEEAILRKSEHLAESLCGSQPRPSKSQWQYLRNNALAVQDFQGLKKC